MASGISFFIGRIWGTGSTKDQACSNEGFQGHIRLELCREAFATIRHCYPPFVCLITLPRFGTAFPPDCAVQFLGYIIPINIHPPPCGAIGRARLFASSSSFKAGDSAGGWNQRLWNLALIETYPPPPAETASRRLGQFPEKMHGLRPTGPAGGNLGTPGEPPPLSPLPSGNPCLPIY